MPGSTMVSPTKTVSGGRWGWGPGAGRDVMTGQGQSLCSRLLVQSVGKLRPQVAMTVPAFPCGKPKPVLQSPGFRPWPSPRALLRPQFRKTAEAQRRRVTWPRSHSTVGAVQGFKQGRPPGHTGPGPCRETAPRYQVLSAPRHSSRGAHCPRQGWAEASPAPATHTQGQLAGCPGLPYPTLAALCSPGGPCPVEARAARLTPSWPSPSSGGTVHS